MNLKAISAPNIGCIQYPKQVGVQKKKKKKVINTKSQHTRLNCQDYPRARVLFKDFSSSLVSVKWPSQDRFQFCFKI